MSNIKWLGDPAKTKCDFCTDLVKDSPIFVDGRTDQGPWALMCMVCFGKHGIGLGTGLGQCYNGTTFDKMTDPQEIVGVLSREVTNHG